MSIIDRNFAKSSTKYQYKRRKWRLYEICWRKTNASFNEFTVHLPTTNYISLLTSI